MFVLFQLTYVCVQSSGSVAIWFPGLNMVLRRLTQWPPDPIERSSVVLSLYCNCCENLVECKGRPIRAMGQWGRYVHDINRKH